MENGKRAAALLLLAVILLLSACGGRPSSGLYGSWAYDYEPGKAVLVLRKNGQAVFEGETCSFGVEDGFLRLRSDTKGEKLLRCSLNEGGMLFYLPNEYVRDSDTEGFVGLWRCAEKNLYYDFKEDGQFVEDGVFAGRYTVDEGEGRFTLSYPEVFDDTSCYYRLDGDRMTVEYPCQLVRMK